MSKFNRANNVSSAVRRMLTHPDATLNLAGGLAFDVDPKTRLYLRACTSLVGEDKYYQGGLEHDAEILKDLRVVAQSDPEWVLKLASYVRHQMKLRSMPIMLLCEAARIPGCRPFIRRWVPSIIGRADELKEAIAYSLQYGRPIPACLRRGIADACHNFDEYQFLKYDQARKGSTVTFVDVLRLCHPKARTRSQEALWGHLCEREVASELIPLVSAKKDFDQLEEWGPKARELIGAGHLTWEVAISKFGNKAEVWNELDLPIMAGLRNLRNLIEAGADLEPVLNKIKDPEIVRRSKLLPFRFYAAAEAIQSLSGQKPFESRDVVRAISKGMEHSLSNIPELRGRTLVLVDVSGSMKHRLSNRSEVTYMAISCLFGAAVAKRMDAIVCAFAADYTFVNVEGASILQGMKAIMSATDHTATYPQRPLEALIRSGTAVDRIVLLSDMQCYRPGWYSADPGFPPVFAQYRQQVNPNVRLYSVDLAGYGTISLPRDEPNVILMAGWSERIFDFINRYEAGDGAVQIVDEASFIPPKEINWADSRPPLEKHVSKKK